MLPGFRFVLATVVLAVSVLIFGLGAAALLRASHDQFASLPTAHAPPEQLPNRDQEQRQTTLALLRVEMMTEQAQAPSQPPAVTEAAKAPAADEPQPVPAPVAVDAPPAPVEPQAAPGSATDQTTSSAESAAVATPASQAPIAVAPVTAPPATTSAEAAPVAAVPTVVDPVADKKDGANEKVAVSAAPVDAASCVPAAATAQTGPQLAMQIDQPPPPANAVQSVAPATRAAPAQIAEQAKRVVHRIHRVRIRHVVVAHKHRRRVIRAARAQYARAQIAARMGQAPQQPNPFSGYPAQTVAPR
jgi:hypothetical protein